MVRINWPQTGMSRSRREKRADINGLSLFRDESGLVSLRWRIQRTTLASAAASARVLTPSLVNTLCTWFLTV